MARGAARIAALILAACLLCPLSAQEPSPPPAASPAPALTPSVFRIVQRHDLRRRVNGAYAGLFYGGSQGQWRIFEAPLPGAEAQGTVRTDGALSVEADYWLTEEGLKDRSKTAQAVDQSLSGSFLLHADGSLTDFEGDSLPFYRSWPPLLPEGALPGDSWVAAATILVDPRVSGSWTEVPVMMECSYAGEAQWQGMPVMELRARYAIRLKRSADAGLPDAPVSGSGSREAWFYLDADTGRPIFARERLSAETWSFPDGGSIKNDGFILSFFSFTGTDSLRREREDLRRRVEEGFTQEEGLSLVEDDQGTTLSLQMLRFVADSPELLAGEEAKLEKIAKLLSALPVEKNFLVIGHTAAVGTVGSQDALSLERARRVAQALAQAGLAAERFLYEGRGGRESLGDDSTEEGRALNRRVELRILD